MNTTDSLIVTPEASTTAGSISYWRLSGSLELAQLTAAWAAQGLPEEMLPKPVGDDVALGRAVREEQQKRILVRPLARRGAWAVVRENVVEDQTKDDQHDQSARLEYGVMLTVRYDDGAPRYSGDNGSPEAHDMINRISDNYRKFRGELAQEDVGTWLVKLAQQCQATSLRDSGGIYFIPRSKVEVWGKIVTAVQECSSNRVFRIPAMRNTEAIDAITDAVTQEAEAIVQQIANELQSLGVKALETRKGMCDELLAKVTSYDELLGVQLKCRERVEGLQALIAAAALAAMAVDEAA